MSIKCHKTQKSKPQKLAQTSQREFAINAIKYKSSNPRDRKYKSQKVKKYKDQTIFTSLVLDGFIRR